MDRTKVFYALLVATIGFIVAAGIVAILNHLGVALFFAAVAFFLGIATSNVYDDAKELPPDNHEPKEGCRGCGGCGCHGHGDQSEADGK